MPVSPSSKTESRSYKMPSPQLLPSTATGWYKRLLMLLVVLTMTGCNTFGTDSTRPALPANLAAPCPELRLFDSHDWDALAEFSLDLAFLYAECKARHAAVVDAWPR